MLRHYFHNGLEVTRTACHYEAEAEESRCHKTIKA